VDRLLCPELIGRAVELDVLASAVEAAASGRATGTVLVGEAGAGKSRLVAEARSRARERGMTVLHGRVREGGSAEPFGAIGEALASGFRSTGWPDDPALRPVRAVLSHLAGEPVPGPTGGPSRLALSEALLRLLDVVSRGPGALLVVEDVHWADVDTLAVLDHLLSHAADHGASCVLTLRPEPAGEAFRVVRRLADTRAVHLIELRPLPGPDVDRMVLACLRADATAAGLLSFLRERSDGIPFFVEELLAGLVRSGALTRSDGTWRVVERRLRSTVPPTVADSVAQRFQALHPRTQQVLHGAALLGRGVDWQLVARVTGLDTESVLASLREATYAQFLESDGDDGRIRFRHALTREHVAALMLPPERSRLAARALEAVAEDHPGLTGEWAMPAAELAELAEIAGDRRAAAAHLLRAAETARDQGALATAAARAERALEHLAAVGGDTLAVREDLATVHALAGDVDAAIDLGSVALEQRRERADAPRREAALELGLGRALLVAGRYAEAHERTDRVRRSSTGAAQLAATALGAQIDAAAGHLDDAIAQARAVLAAAAGDAAPAAACPPAVVCEAWEALGQASRAHDIAAAEGAFEAALAVADEHGLLTWRARALHELGTVDLLDSMRTDRLEAARRAAVEAGAPATVTVVDFHLAEALVARGHAAAGRAAAERAIARARRVGSSVIAPAYVTLARSYAHELRPDEMDSALGQARAAAPGDRAIEAGAWGRARAMLALHQADAAGALAALDRAVELLRELPGHHFPHWGLWALLRTLHDGDPDGAARREARVAAGSGTRFNRVLLRAAEAVAAGMPGTGVGTGAGAGPGPGRVAGTGAGAGVDPGLEFDAAVAELSGYTDADWLVHLVRWLVAPAAHRDGWGDPLRWLQEAVRWFADHGRPALATACRTLLRDAGGRVPRRGRGISPVPETLLASGVSSREVDVLRLLGRRLSNRGIAEELVLSPRTVEKHVASLLRKTGAGDRAELAELAAALTGGPPHGSARPTGPSTGNRRAVTGGGK
jgi:DNA-binding CsgD family transcriptional regulator/tetratricopeptide (TPR) repeat protein